MFYYVTFAGYKTSASVRIYDHAVFSISSLIQAPLSQILKHYKKRADHVDNIRIVLCRVITPDDYQGFLREGVPPFHIEKEN